MADSQAGRSEKAGSITSKEASKADLDVHFSLTLLLLGLEGSATRPREEEEEEEEGLKSERNGRCFTRKSKKNRARFGTRNPRTANTRTKRCTNER